MKHLTQITKKPGSGALWQEIVCNVAVGVNIFLTFLGGTSPAFQYVEDKCDIPVANETDTGTDA